uniref:CHK kinase-like domain-containing protein n=1 Tax=Anopheles christyi TaxID=43041 RepID=A0A182K9B0_9DIPT
MAQQINGHAGADPAESVVEQVPEMPAYLYAALEQLAPKEGFTEGNFSIEFDFGSSKGDGFVGQMFKATISEGDRSEVYLCKIPPLDDARREQFGSMAAFAREALVYDRFLPTIYEYQRGKGIVSADDGFFHTPHCYHAHCDETTQESVIIMEDLRLREFRLWNKHNIIDYAHATLFMTHLGRLHAISLAMKCDQPEKFEPFKLPNPFDVMLKADGPFRNMILSQLQMVIDALDEQDTIERAKMEQLREDVFDELARCGTAQLAEPYTVVGHGDCWTNNMMFRYEEGIPQEIVLLDWQVMRYVTPVQDLVYFIFCCTDGEFRRKYYHEMIDVYYSSLSTMLAKLQHDASQLFPRAALDEQLRVFGRYGILMGMFLVPMMCTRNEELPDIEALAHKMTQTQQLDESFFKTTEDNREAYATRMRAVVQDCIRLATSLPDYISAGLEEVAREQGFTEGLFRFETESGSNMGDGFVGELLKVFIREADRELVVLCKLLPESEMRKQQGIALFDRETDLYMKVLPLLLNFQQEKALAEHLPRFENVPRCYYAKTTVDKMESVIIMEDLRLQAFRMWDKANPVDFEHAHLLMVTLGRLHALSFAMKDQQPEEYAQCREFTDPMGNMLEQDPTKGFEKMMVGMCRRAIDTLEKHDTFRREKLQLFENSCVQEIVACTDGKAAEPYAIIGHGDCWSNNMMFQYQDDNKTPSNIKLIDWQLSRYGSPVLDLVYFIFNCTDEELRAHGYQRLLSIYYHSLSEHLHNLGGDVERQYPRSAFRDQLKKFGRYGLMMSMMVLPIICTPNDELPDTDKAMEGFMNELNDGKTDVQLSYGTTEKAAIRYQKRMSGCIRDTIRYGYI